MEELEWCLTIKTMCSYMQALDFAQHIETAMSALQGPIPTPAEDSFIH